MSAHSSLHAKLPIPVKQTTLFYEFPPIDGSRPADGGILVGQIPRQVSLICDPRAHAEAVENLHDGLAGLGEEGVG